MGVSQRHDLATVGGVRQNLLITRHGGIENHLTHGGTRSANRQAAKERAIFQGEDSWLRQTDLPVVVA